MRQNFQRAGNNEREKNGCQIIDEGLKAHLEFSKLKFAPSHDNSHQTTLATFANLSLGYTDCSLFSGFAIFMQILALFAIYLGVVVR